MRSYYKQGQLDALTSMGLTADGFAEQVQNDETRATEKAKDQQLPAGKNVSWSGAASLDAGDAGTRNEQMGLPRYSGA